MSKHAISYFTKGNGSIYELRQLFELTQPASDELGLKLIMSDRN